jgi:hypothetical protein
MSDRERFGATGDPADWPATAQVGYVPDYTGTQLRLQCLSMALMVADGAAPPSLREAIERAEAYWQFVATGGSVVEDPRLNTR